MLHEGPFEMELSARRVVRVGVLQLKVKPAAETMGVFEANRTRPMTDVSALAACGW
jgi:hypothetical protein